MRAPEVIWWMYAPAGRATIALSAVIRRDEDV